MKIVIITPTGDRPKSLARQSRYISRSIIPAEAKVYWIVVDDGQTPFDPPPISNGEKIYFRRPPGDPKTSLVSNLIMGLAYACTVSPDHVLFWEDDDWYSPKRIMDQLFEIEMGWTLHGYNNSLYYHAPMRIYKEMKNRTASLFEMAFKGSLTQYMLYFVQEQTGDGKGLDRAIWRKFGNDGSPSRHMYHSIGIKGLAGRMGIGVGHSPGEGWMKDPDFVYLLKLMPKEDLKEIMDCA